MAKIKIALRGNTKRVFDYMKSHRGITSMEAFTLFGATRLSGIIFNLRSYGYKIKSFPRTGKNRYGDSVHFVEYRLK